MITTDYIRLMARYNRWQNHNLYTAAATLGDAQRRQDRGAFFGSIHGTLSHLLWGDTIWMHRFAGTPAPGVGIKDSPMFRPDWQGLQHDRAAMDEAILDWSQRVTDDWVAGSMTWYSGAAGRELTRPNALLTAHFFNHQTHHRGQVHALLTSFGAKPADTDLMLLPDEA